MEIRFDKFFMSVDAKFIYQMKSDQGTGDLNEIGFVHFLENQYPEFLGYKVICTKGTYADLAYKVDVIVMQNGDFVKLFQVKSSEYGARKAWYDQCLSKTFHTYNGINYKVNVFYPNEKGRWVEYKG